MTGRASALPSERDQNFLLQADGGPAFVLKIANAGESRAMLEAENAAMRHLAASGLVPALMMTRAGEDIATSGDHLVRLVTCLAGAPLGETRRHSDALLDDLGRAVATIDRALADFDHPALHREFYWDLAGAAPAVRAHLPRRRRSRVARLTRLPARRLRQHRRAPAPVAPHERHSRRRQRLQRARRRPRQRVTGIVDFGDMVFSHTVNDAAIAMAYAALGKSDPLGGRRRCAARLSRGVSADGR